MIGVDLIMLDLEKSCLKEVEEKQEKDEREEEEKREEHNKHVFCVMWPS